MLFRSSFLRKALSQTTVTGTASGAFRGFPLSQMPVAAKTGTGEVVGKASTSWFASFAPANSPKYAVTCMVSQGGTGAGTCGPSVRAIYEALLGVNGSSVSPGKSILSGGKPSSKLPDVTSDGIGQSANSMTVATEVVNQESATSSLLSSRL